MRNSVNPIHELFGNPEPHKRQKIKLHRAISISLEPLYKHRQLLRPDIYNIRVTTTCRSDQPASLELKMPFNVGSCAEI